MSGKILYDDGEFKIIDCQDSGFVRVLNPPTDKRLDEIYENEYYSNDKPDYIDSYYKDIEWWTEIYKYRLNLMSRYSSFDKKKLIDIGSGPGLLLEVANQLGWVSKGYEPNIDAYPHSKKKGFNVENSFFDGTEKNLTHIYLGEVLEHIKKPKSFLKSIFNSMEKGGVLSIIVPNDGSLIHNILNDGLNFKKWFYAPPFHLNYFTVDSLKKLVESVGFNTVHLETTFSIESMLLLGENYLDQPNLGRKWHKRRMIWEIKLLRKKPELYEKSSTHMGSIGPGREIFIILKK